MYKSVDYGVLLINKSKDIYFYVTFQEELCLICILYNQYLGLYGLENKTGAHVVECSICNSEKTSKIFEQCLFIYSGRVRLPYFRSLFELK